MELMDCPRTPRTPRTPRSKAAKVEHNQELLIAESFYPIMPLKPRPKGLPRKRINYEELRAQMRTPPPTPERHPSPPRMATTPRKKKNSLDSLFINRKPLVTASPLRVPSERVRRALGPYDSPSRPQIVKRVCSDPTDITSGPAPWIVYTRVPQTALYPSELAVHERPLYPRDDDVVLGAWELLGCCIITPDSVSKQTLNIRSADIVICFQWVGYEEYGIFETTVDIPKFQDDPFGSRLTIIREVNSLFYEFRRKVSYFRKTGQDTNRPGVDVLAFVEGDIRVTRLERRVDNLYQVVFTYPTRSRSR